MSSQSVRSGRRGGGGVPMIEMLVVLGLLTAFALIASRLFTASMRTLERSRNVETGIAAFESAVGRMRADVWAAKDVKTVDPRTLAVTAAGGTAMVTWTASAEGAL